MWIWASPYMVAVGKPTTLPSPKEPKRSAARVPGAMAPTPADRGPPPLHHLVAGPTESALEPGLGHGAPA